MTTTTAVEKVNGVAIDYGAVLRTLKLDPRDANVQALVLTCQQYELDPVLKHMILIQGAPYVTHKGLWHIAHRSGLLNGEEVVEAGETGSEWWATVAIYRKDWERPVTMTGRYPKSGTNKHYGPEMAVTRAECLVLRRMFDVAAPVQEEIDWPTPPPRGGGGAPTADIPGRPPAGSAERVIFDSTIEADIPPNVDPETGERKVTRRPPPSVDQDRPALPAPRQSVAQAAPPAGTLPAGRGEPSLPPLPNEVAQQAGDSRSDNRAKGEAPRAQSASGGPASRSHAAIDAGEGGGTGSPAAVASPPDPVLADDMDRAALKAQVEALPADLARTALKERKAAGIPALSDDTLTKAHVAAIEALLLPLIKEQSSRSKKLVLVLKKAGLESDAERHGLIRYATDGRVESSKKVTEEDSYLCLAAAADVDDGKLVMHVGDDGAVFFLPADLGATEVAG